MYVGSLPTVSNKATYRETFEVSDSDNDETVDLTTATITYVIREKESKSIVLTATNDDGVDMSDAADGVFEVTFTDTQMRSLCEKQYEVGCTIEIDGDVSQYIIGRMDVLDGIVS